MVVVWLPGTLENFLWQEFGSGSDDGRAYCIQDSTRTRYSIHNSACNEYKTVGVAIPTLGGPKEYGRYPDSHIPGQIIQRYVESL